MYRDPKQSGLQLVDGVLSGEHLGDERILRASQRPVPDRRNQARADHG